MVFLFFGLLAIYGMQVLIILQGEHLVSMPEVPTQLTQSVIPVGAVLFVIAEALRLPDILRDARTTGFVDLEIKEALELGHTDDPDQGGKAGGSR